MTFFDFSPRNYERLIEEYLKKGYHFCLFNQALNWEGNPIVFFRHDIDLDIAAALELAKLEKKCEIHSTYCFSLSSPYYNLLGKLERSIIREISDNGHDIALHYDSSQYEDSFFGISQEIEIFYLLFPFSNKQIFSIHRPVKLSESSSIDHMTNLSSTIILEHPIFYISDSTGQWLYGQPLQSLEFEQLKNMQVLTHPVWWIREGTNPLDKIEDSLLENFKAKKEYLHVYFPKLFKILSEREIKNAD